jgi:hypothetical protein
VSIVRHRAVPAVWGTVRCCTLSADEAELAQNACLRFMVDEALQIGQGFAVLRFSSFLASGQGPGLGLRLSDGACGGTSGLTTCARLGEAKRGRERNRTAISLPFRRTTSQGASKPSSSIISSNVSGALTEPVTRSRAPVSDTSRTVHGSVERRSLNATMPPFRTRRRGSRRLSSCPSIAEE